MDLYLDIRVLFFLFNFSYGGMTLLREGLTVGIILLFIGVAVAPSININVVKASIDSDFVVVTNGVYKINEPLKNNIDIYPMYNYNFTIRREVKDRTRNVPKLSEEMISMILPYSYNNRLWYTDLNKNDPNIIYVPDDYPSIQSAVENATAGDTIVVRDGSYKESIFVDKSLTIMSEHGAGNCSITQLNNGVCVFIIVSDFVTISGFYIRGITEQGSINCNRANNSIIVGNVIRDFIYCISIYNSFNVTLKNNRLGNFWGVQYRGVDIVNSFDCKVENNTITNHGEWGLRFYNSSNNFVFNNYILSNNYNIICDALSNNNMFFNNSFGGSGWAEFFILNSYFNTVINNSFPSAFIDGLLLIQSNYNTIKNNIFNNDGLFVYASYHNCILNNVVNGKPLYYLENESNIQINESGGQIIIVNCSHIFIRNQAISHTVVGVELLNTNNFTLLNSNISYTNYETFYAVDSDHNKIINCIFNEGYVNLAFYDSESNLIDSNKFFASYPVSECIILDNSHYNTISKNILKQNFYGIVLHGSNNNNISYNDLSEQECNKYDGIIQLYNSNNNSIAYNYIHPGYRGIELLDSSNNNVVMKNIFNSSEIGIGITASYDNKIYSNNFLNGRNGFSEINYRGPSNKWDSNYWYKLRILPKLILGTISVGKIFIIQLFWFNIDWHPALKPYDIPGYNNLYEMKRASMKL
jgi:parallel beta-helix repeat protein